MLFDAAILTIILGAVWLLFYRFTSGKLPRRFGVFDLRATGLFISSFGLLCVLTVFAEIKPLLIRSVFPYFYVLSYLLLILAAVRNWHLPGMRVALLGIILNAIVITANAGRMPVDLNLLRRTHRPDLEQRLVTGKSQQHAVLTPNTKLAFLADVLILPSPYPRPCIFSIGDIFITIGACWLILLAMGAGKPGSNDDETAPIES